MESMRIMLQMKASSTLASSSFGMVPSAPFTKAFSNLTGVQLDTTFSPVPIPSSQMFFIKGFGMENASAEPPTFIVRGTVEAETLDQFVTSALKSEEVVGIFSDPKIEPISICPNGPFGSHLDVEQLLKVPELIARGLDGSGVNVVIVDTGINIPYLRNRGKNPYFNGDLSWGPIQNQPLGSMPVGHGTMCGYDVCIAAPACTLIDHPVLTSLRRGGSSMDGLLSDAVASYGILLSYMTKASEPFAGDHLPRTLVVNNSWGMFHQSWDFPIQNVQNYSDNPAHPFNIIVASLEAAGADILFAAGNCGPECPDSRCSGDTDSGIMGANSSPSVLCVGGVMVNMKRIGYSTKGPGRLQSEKPDITCFTHFAGSGVYAADGGTSAATPVAAGVVAAIRKLYPSSVLSPGELRNLLRRTATPVSGQTGFNYECGYGVLSVSGLLQELDQLFPQSAVR